MNKARIQQIIDSIDELVAEATHECEEHPDPRMERAILLAMEVGKMQAAQDILKAVCYK